MLSQQFWLVWKLGGRAPRHLHLDEGAAQQEAMRLALAHPNKTFIVLRAIEAMRADEHGALCAISESGELALV